MSRRVNWKFQPTSLTARPLVQINRKGSNPGSPRQVSPSAGQGGPMKTAIIIPARYASSRLPGKPLLRETGKYLVQHVYERACLARRANQVIIATDDPRIMAAVQSF